MPCSATLKLIRKHYLQMAGSAKIFTGEENEAILSIQSTSSLLCCMEKVKSTAVGLLYSNVTDGANLILKFMSEIRW